MAFENSTRIENTARKLELLAWLYFTLTLTFGTLSLENPH